MAKREPKKALSKVAAAVKRTASKVTSKLRHDGHDNQKEAPAPLPRMATKKKAAPATTARRKRTEPDVPVELAANTYTPTQTSLKAGFRASGADRQRDQDRFADERWNDEDRLTNKSGDPRIGTHGRTYEPGE